MSKYVPKDHPAQRIPMDELERQAAILSVTPETIRTYAAIAFDAGFIRFHGEGESFAFELTVPGEADV